MPTITGVVPQAFGDGRSVTVTGSGFGTSGTVTIGGLAQNVTSWTDTTVVFTAVRGTQSMGPAVLDVVGGGGTAPNYTPLATWSAAGGTVGSSLSNITSSIRAVYSNDVAGPFGGSVVAKDAIPSGGTAYGMTWLNNRSPAIASHGDTIWFRVFVYFANDFAFNYGTSPGDGWGGLKFIRFEDNDGNPGNRYTFQLAVTAQAAGTRTTSHIKGATDEVGAAPNLNDFFSPTPSDLITRGAWHSIEVSMKVANATTNDGYIRVWIDDTYVGEVSGVDNVGTGFAIDTLVLGNYWNGSTTQANTWYWDELILTTETPNTTDSGGRPFIGSTRRVVDF